MKKFFALFVCCASMMAANAQKVFVSPTETEEFEIGMWAEGMSANTKYATGMETYSGIPVIWDATTNEVSLFIHVDTVWSEEPIYGTTEGWDYFWNEDKAEIDSVWSTELIDYDNILGYDSVPYDDFFQGSFHMVSNNGIAVGEFGSGYATKVPAYAQMGDKDVTFLYMDETDELGSAYDINADGSIILGFAGPGGVMTPYIWKNGGQKKTDRIALPIPTEEEFGGPIDYAAARWMSEDASVILGYAQDSVNGSIVMIYWTQNNDGSYTVHGDYAKQYFTPFEWIETGEYDEWGNPIQEGRYLHSERPYTRFEPYAISANGEWVTLVVTPKYDLNDWFAESLNQAARLNLKTKQLEILALPEGETEGPELFGIANNGTAAGRLGGGAAPGPLAPQRSQAKSPKEAGENIGTQGIIWPIGAAEAKPLVEIMADEEFFKFEGYSYEMGLGAISADANRVVGYVFRMDEDYNGEYVSFIADMGGAMGVRNASVENVKAIKTIENGQLIIIRGAKRYNAAGAEL